MWLYVEHLRPKVANFLLCSIYFGRFLKQRWQIEVKVLPFFKYFCTILKVTLCAR